MSRKLEENQRKNGKKKKKKRKRKNETIERAWMRKKKIQKV